MVHADKLEAALFRTVFSRVEFELFSTIENKARGHDFFNILHNLRNQRFTMLIIILSFMPDDN